MEDKGKQTTKYPLYQLFLEYANHSEISNSGKSPTKRDANLGRMKQIVKCMEKIEKEITFEVIKTHKKEQDCHKKEQILQRRSPGYYELDWEEIKDERDPDTNHKIFLNLEHFFICCSLYFDFIPKYNFPEEGATAEPEEGATAEPEEGATAEPEEGATAEPEEGATAEPEEGATAEPEEGATAEAKEGATAEPEEGATAEPEEGATAEPKEGATAEPKEGATAEPEEGATAEPKEGATAEPEEGATAEPQLEYPLKIKLKLFRHDTAFYILPKSHVWHDYGKPMERSLYVTTLDEDFKGTKHSNTPKQTKREQSYNYEAYPGICKILHANGGLRRQQNIASHLLAALDGTEEQCEEPSPSDMKTIRAMVMALVIPFIAEIAPPSDDAIKQIHAVHTNMMKGEQFDKAQLKNLGGGNPGCHMLCKYLFETIKEGINNFKKVFLHPEYGDEGKPEFLPSKTNGVSEYRASMFNSRDEVILRMQDRLNQV